MQDNYQAYEQRKKQHIQLALHPDNQSIECNQLDNLQLIHEAMPELNFSDIILASVRLKKKVLKPFIVSSMTAGHSNALTINHNLMEACVAQHWAMGVGSQRREIADPFAAKEWQYLRKEFEKLEIYSNLGIAELITTEFDILKKLRDNLGAHAFIIHLNPLQECIQPEGNPQFKGAYQALEQLVRQIDIPVIVKETGCGFSMHTLKRLNETGIAAVEISGLGGTHWGRIEGQRALSDDPRRQTALTFKHWGIDTVQSLLNARKIEPAYEIWGSGGVRNGLDAAKLLALGATNIGFAKIMLEAALISAEAVKKLMAQIEYELKTALFCTGSLNLKELTGKAAL